jgi:DnaA family protein
MQATSVFRQLPLSFEPREVFSFSSYISGDNEIAVATLRQCAISGTGAEKQLYLWSGETLGKSHLLQAACNLAAKQQAAVCYLPAAEIIDQPVQLLDDLEQLDLLCIDDIQLFAGNAAWEEALFNLINRIRGSDCKLLMSASLAPEKLPVRLPDLRSRLVWGPVFQLRELGDSQKREALTLRAQMRGLELPENVADYLLRHYPRDLFGLFERLEKLDTAAMALQRKLTIPFIKTVFSSGD